LSFGLEFALRNFKQTSRGYTELDAPAFVTLVNGENYSRKLQAIKKNYKRNSKNKTSHQF